MKPHTKLFNNRRNSTTGKSTLSDRLIQQLWVYQAREMSEPKFLIQ